MNCIDSVKLPFCVTINVPDGFFYNDENQLSLAVSTDDLNIYVVEESFSTDEIKNPCTEEYIDEVIVYISEIRMAGTLAFRMALNALVSSYNFMLGSQTNVNADGWSSTDGFVKIQVVDEGVLKDYIVIGYVDPRYPDKIPTRDEIYVTIENYNVTENMVGTQRILELSGEFSFKIVA